MDSQEIEKEKGTIIQEINMREDNPMGDVGNVFEKLLYRENSLGRDVIGYKKTVAAFRRKNFMDYLKRFYVANDTVICIAGKFNEKEVKAQLQKYFRNMQRGKKPSLKKITEKQKNPEAESKFKKTDQTHFILGNRAYPENHKDRFVLALLSIILGGNMSSRLFIEVREKRGLAYYVRTSVDTYQDCGYLATQAGVEHKNLPLAVKTILSEYKKIATEKVSEKELQRAKDYIKGKSVMGLESSDEVAMFFITQEIRKQKILTIQEIFRRIDKVVTADILRVARDVFQQSKLNLAVIGPHKTKGKLKNLLKL